MERIKEITINDNDVVLSKLLKYHKELCDKDKINTAGSQVDYLKNYRNEYDDYEGCFISSRVLGYFVDDELVGFLSFEHYNSADNRVLSIDLLYVDEEHRRKGIAKNLIDYVKSLDVETEVIQVVVYTENYSAVEFYKSIGLISFAHFMGVRIK